MLLRHGCKQEDVEQSLVMHPGLTVINLRVGGLSECSTTRVER